MMTIGFVFWLLMLIWLIFGVVANRPPAGSAWPNYYPLGQSVLAFVLFLLLGISVYGWPIKG